MAVTLLQATGHVDVRVVGRSIWSPVRSRREKVPSGVRSAYLSLGAAPSVGSSPAVKAGHGILTGARAERLAALLNQLPTAQLQPAPAGCSTTWSSPFTARFTFGNHTLVFSRTLGDCWITPRYDGVTQPALGDGEWPILPTLQQLLRGK